MAALGDMLAGIGGAPVNRPGLEAFVAGSQAKNGLVTAQTNEALLSAQNMQDEMAAKQRVKQSLGNYLAAMGDTHPTEHADAAGDLMQSKYGNWKDTEAGFLDAQKQLSMGTVADKNADPNARLAADQALNPGANPYQVDQGQLIPRFQQNLNHPTVIQTPGSQATQQSQLESARLHGAQADAGGFNPHTAGVSGLPPEQQAAIQHAVDEGRLNFKDINSRNAAIIGSLALNNPTYNFNRAAADAALSRNSTFQQRAMVVDSLPGLISNTASLGKKLNYSDVQVVGQAKKWLLGQTNDPDLTEYMTARNDVLMKIANVMRGVGMSDKAHEAEVEAMSPTLSPAALDAWVKGQMTAVGPLMDAQKRAAHIGEPGVNGSTPHAGATPPAPQGGTNLADLAKAELQRRGIKVP